MTFWIAAAVLTLVIAAWLTWSILRKRKAQTPVAEFDLQVYRDQLKEVEKDRARGVISEEDAQRTKVEVSRRILEADKALAAGDSLHRAPRGATIGAAVLTVALLGGGGVALYDSIGAPGYPDLPLKSRMQAAEEARKTRPSQAEIEAQVKPDPSIPAPDPENEELVDKLRQVTQERPDDLQGFSFLARSEAAIGNFKAGYVAQQRAIELKGEQTTSGDYAMLADLMILAAGGYVSPEAEAAISQSLARDRNNGTALYYAGLMYAQTGRPDVAFAYWRPLLEASPADAPWVAPIRAQIEEAAYYAGIEYRLPAAASAAPMMPGPSAEDMDAAADMTPEERMEMIRGMVDRLGERLATEGGSADEWARLVNALAMLNETEQAAAIWAEAQQVFAGKPEMLATVEAAARNAGVVE